MIKTLKPYLSMESESGGETFHYFALYDDIPDEFKMIAEQELKETEAKRTVGLRLLKECLKIDEKNLVNDKVLLAFLRNQKYDFQKAKIKMQKYIPKYIELKNYLSKVDMNVMEEIIDSLAIGILPYRDKHGRVIVYLHPDGLLNLEKYSMHDGMAVLSTVMLMLLYKYPLTSITGVVFFGENKGISFYDLYSFITSLKDFSPLVTSTPVRVGRIEIMNINRIFQGVLEIIRPLLSRKLNTRFYFHKEEFRSLHKVYDPKLLPEEFGGSMGCRNNAFYKKELMDFMSELRNEIST